MIYIMYIYILLHIYYYKYIIKYIYIYIYIYSKNTTKFQVLRVLCKITLQSSA